jgi:hypothetical protein
MKKKVKNNDEHKVLLVYKDLEENIQTESVWAEKVGDNYKVLNIPFFAPNLAYGDIIKVEDDDGILYFDELVEESGHSTIQMIIFDNENQRKVEEDLIKLGCDWEGSHLENYISIDVPDTVSYSEIKEYLNKGRANKKWDYKEACLSTIHRK